VKPDAFDPYDEFFGRKVDVKSQYENEWVLDQKSMESYFK